MPRFTPLRLLVTFIAAILAFALITYRPADPRRLGGTAVVYIVDNGFHTDLAIPRGALDRAGPMREALALLPPSPWVLVGWGDERFYTHTGFSTARVADGLRALFGPDNPSVIRLTTLDRAPTQAFYPRDLMAVRLTEQGLAGVVGRIDGAFARPLRSPTRWGPAGRFFASRERFSVLHLCNHWTGEVLHAGGTPDIPLLDTFPGGLRLGLRLNPAARRALYGARPSA